MTKTHWRVVVVIICVLIAGLAVLDGIAPGFAQEPRLMGARDVAVIPLESVPEWNHAGVIRLTSHTREVEVEVLAVLKDPREIPTHRFLYSLTDRDEVVVHPRADQIRARFPDGKGTAVAVYVRVTAPDNLGDGRTIDPFYVQSLELQESNDWFYSPFRVIGVADTREEGMILPCLDPMTIGEGVRAFDTPDTGIRVEPDAYLPPEPQYTVIDQTNVAGKVMGEMDAGEVREGWVLCLAPDIPQDQIRIVSSGILFNEVERYGHGFPFWTHDEALSAGEWALYEDQVVVAWNGPVELGENRIPAEYEKSVVHEGDVWVSVGQALRYGSSTLATEHPFASDAFFIQLNFEGMEDLLDTWDHFAIQDPFHLEVCDGIEFEQCELRGDLTSDIREDLQLVSDGGRVVRRVFAAETGEDPVTAWVRIGKLHDEPHFINHRTWKVDVVNADESEGERLGACAPGECIAPGANFYYDDGKPYAGGDGRLFNDEVAVPIIPLGEEAQGFKVLGARVITGSVLRAYGLRLSLQERDSGFPLESNWLLIEVESIGDLQPDNIIRKNGSDWNIVTNVGLETYYGLSAGYHCIGQPRDSKNRSALQNSFLIGGIPINWQLEELFIATYSGPVWSLH
jgi:hypothetical protein